MTKEEEASIYAGDGCLSPSRWPSPHLLLFVLLLHGVGGIHLFFRRRRPVQTAPRRREERRRGAKRSRDEWEQLVTVFRHFSKSGWASDQALAIYIPRPSSPPPPTASAASSSSSSATASSPPPLPRPLPRRGPLPLPGLRRLLPRRVPGADEEAPPTGLLRGPHFPPNLVPLRPRHEAAHRLPLRTHQQRQDLQRVAEIHEAEKAVYCSPLRLLAMEVFDKVNATGVYCSLLTGQEHKAVPFSRHTACTVEMVSTEELYEVAVIDEIQMMADPTRGCAWTRALLGLMADEIHLCGDPSVLAMVRKLCADTGDELVEKHYQRFKPLVVEALTLRGDLRNVRAGDCIVAFSRREIFEVKLAVEKFTPHRCCVIYGALPPETRRQQAGLFNEEGNQYDVLVASDAVGMGLNLNIRRVVFYSLSKYDGEKVVPVGASQVKQIAGRAGRRGSRYPDGLVTTFQSGDLPYLVDCLRRPFEEVKQVGLFPFFEQVELFAGQFPELPFPQLLDKFRQSCRLDGAFFLSRHDHVKKVANLLERVEGLSLVDRFNFCLPPKRKRKPLTTSSAPRVTT
ncbi:unnamed protein product [Spirodela intermedia]|uniref:RNA helicase n=1 Tax=Spirodela intermedia TaxID=51605 RepID=A0A7I8J544_SPIIN|nr:unnamed protein product [Spirodela intermedia]CAA6665174.1 unnamed protein product [Spirodela intermedia]